MLRNFSDAGQNVRAAARVSIDSRTQGQWELPHLAIEKGGAFFEHTYILDPSLTIGRTELEVALSVETWWSVASIELLCVGCPVTPSQIVDPDRALYEDERKRRVDSGEGKIKLQLVDLAPKVEHRLKRPHAAPWDYEKEKKRIEHIESERQYRKKLDDIAIKRKAGSRKKYRHVGGNG